MSRSDKKAAKASAFSGLAMTAITWLIKSQFGSPVAMAQWFLAKLQKQSEPRKVPSSRPDRVRTATHS